MARTAVATLPLLPDCRWSRPATETDWIGVARTRTEWVCEHDGTPRPVHEQECETCAHFEPRAAAAIAHVDAPARTLTLRPTAYQVAHAATLAVILLVAVLMIALGTTVLTTVWAIPVTVAFWLVAAALGGYAVFGRLPQP